MRAYICVGVAACNAFAVSGRYPSSAVFTVAASCVGGKCVVVYGLFNHFSFLLSETVKY